MIFKWIFCIVIILFQFSISSVIVFSSFFLSCFLLIFVMLRSYAWNISYDLYRGASNKRSGSPWYSVTVFLSPRCVFSTWRHPLTDANKAYEVWCLYRINQSEIHILRMIITTNFLSRCKKSIWWCYHLDQSGFIQ